MNLIFGLGLRIMLDLCEMGPFEGVLSNDTDVRSGGSGYMQVTYIYTLNVVILTMYCIWKYHIDTMIYYP